MAEPDYLICLECETPCYSFQWKGNQIVDILCEACGNDDTEQFLTQEEADALTTPH